MWEADDRSALCNPCDLFQCDRKLFKREMLEDLKGHDVIYCIIRKRDRRDTPDNVRLKLRINIERLIAYLRLGFKIIAIHAVAETYLQHAFRLKQKWFFYLRMVTCPPVKTDVAGECIMTFINLRCHDWDICVFIGLVSSLYRRSERLYNARKEYVGVMGLLNYFSETITKRLPIILRQMHECANMFGKIFFITFFEQTLSFKINKNHSQSFILIQY